MAKVSIIIPTHNRPDLLRRALKSVANQTYRDFEVIVVDDGDNPRAEDVVAEFRDQFLYRYMETNKNQGGSATRNIGIKNSQSELISFLDDDDQWEEGKLEKQVDVFLDKIDQVGFSFTAVKNLFDHRSEITKVPEGVVDLKLISLTRFKGFLTSTLLVKKEALDYVGGFDESLPSHQEADLVLRLAQHFKGLGLSEPLTIMDATSNHEHIGSSLDRRIVGRERLLAKHKRLFEDYSKQLSFHYFWLGLRYRERGKLEDSTACFKKSLKLNFKLRTLAHLVKGWLLNRIFKPIHFGTLVRELYFNFYFKKYFSKLSLSQALDAGCGQGQYAEMLAKWAPSAEVVGLDIKPASAWADCKLPNLSFEVGDLRDWEAVEKYDLIVSIDNLEHIPNNLEVVKNFFRALKPGGHFYLAVPCEATGFEFLPRKWFSGFKEWEKDEHIGEQWTLVEWQQHLKTLGFRIKLARHTFTFWGIIGWEIEYLLRGRTWGNRLNLVLMPMYRVLAYLDLFLPIGRGNNLIIAQK